MSNKLITLITGANQGIGYHAARQFAATGKYHVLLGSRSTTKGQEAVQSILADDQDGKVNASDLEVLEIDVTSDSSISAAAKTVQDKFGRLDILLNNAGISTHPDPKASTREQYQAIFNANLFGAAVVTDTLLPLLRSSSLPGGKRIIFTSSSLSSLTLATADGSMFPGNVYPLYRSSKTALNMIMANYHAELEKEGFVVGSVCPGYCGTNLNGFQGYKDPALGAKILLRAVEGKKEDVALKVIHADGPNGQEGAYPW